MRIDFQTTPQSAAEVSSSKKAAVSTSAATAGKLQSDRTDFSTSHLDLRAMALQAQPPEVREQRVQSLREAIAAGQYQPRPEQIAGALFSHMVGGTRR